MSGDAQLVLWIAGVHLLGLMAVAVLLLPALRDAPAPPGDRSDSDGDDGWGRGPTPPPDSPGPPRGGVPLTDAVPARVRLREPGRLSDRLPSHPRRPVHPPGPAQPRQPVGPGRRPN
ncbi:MAG: hypothetical protein ABI355_08720 [Solirubrobacteraceae bacterium]